MLEKISNMSSTISYTDNYIDLAGISGLAFLPDTNSVVTCGASSEVRIWQVDNGQVEPAQEFLSNDAAVDVAVNANYIFGAFVDKNIMYKERNSEDAELCLLFEASHKVTAIDVQQSSHNHLAIGFTDGNVQLYNPEDASWTEKTTIKAHEGQVFSVKFDAKHGFLSSSGSDGTIALWSVESGKEIQRFSACVQKEFDENTKLSPFAFHPRDDFAVYIQHNTLTGISLDEFDKTFDTEAIDDVGKLLFVSFSCDGKFVSACDHYRVFIYEWKTNAFGEKPLFMKQFDPLQTITGLQFSSQDSQVLAAVNNQGVLQLMKLDISKSVTCSSSPKNVDVEDDFSALLDGDDEFDDELCSMEIPVSKSFSEANDKKPLKLQESEHSRDSKDSADDKIPKYIDEIFPRDDSDNNDDKNDDDEDSDIGAIKRRYQPDIFGEEAASSKSAMKSLNLCNDGVLYVDGFRIEGKELVDLIRQSKKAGIESMQEAFQSGSTPVHHQRRFMVWNSVGVVYAHKDDDENSIDVDFHEVNFHHTIHLENDLNYTIADLSTSCLLLASNSDHITDEERTKIFCQQLKTADKLKTWDASLPRGEKVETLAAGTNFIAIASSAHFLRIWNNGGIQTMIVSLYGPAVTLSAAENRLMVLYHQATHFAGRGQSIGCQVLKIDHRAKTRKHPMDKTVQVALSPNSTVYWAGFTDEFTPCVVDSKNIVRLYKPHFGGAWVPVADLKRSNNLLPLDHFFVVGISELLNQVRCLFCKASKYPITSPRPIMTVKPLEIPLTETDTQKGKYEESLIRNRMNCSLLKKLALDGFEVDGYLEGAMKQVNTSCVKLFALALIAGQDWLALDIVKMMPDQVAIEGAIRFAREKNNRSMATRLIELLKDYEEEESENEEEAELENILRHKKQEQEEDEWMESLEKDKDHKPRSRIALSKVDNEADSVALKPKKMNAMPENAKVLNNVRNLSPVTVFEDPLELSKIDSEKLAMKNPFKRAAEGGKLQAAKRKKV